MSRYIYDPELESERERINSLQAASDPETMLVLEQIGIEKGWRCLEVGGGGGSIARWLAEKVGPDGSVVATDLNTRFLDEIDLPNLEVRKHDVVNEELGTAEFDLVHSRFLLEHLPERDAVLDKMIAAVRPGGWIVVEDVDFESAVWANPDELVAHPSGMEDSVARVRRGILEGMRRAGIDPEYGRRLPVELEKRGLQEVGGRGSYRFLRGGSPQANIARLGLKQMRDRFVSAGFLTEEDLDAADGSLADPASISTAPVLVAAWGRTPTP